jgi:hypothetical protein
MADSLKMDLFIGSTLKQPMLMGKRVVSLFPVYLQCHCFHTKRISRLLNQSPSVVSVLVQKNKTGKRSQKNSSPVQTVATAVIHPA